MTPVSTLKKQIMKGFTLVELLIVVIILAILAAIVVPQFASSTDDAKLSSLDTTLSNMRSAIDLYYQQHGNYPARVASSGAPAACTTTVTGGAIDTQAAFLEQLAFYTNAAGQACKMRGTGNEFKFGPYLKKDAAPTNPITTVSTIAVGSTGNLGLESGVTNGTGGWLYDSKTGQFIANDHRLIPPSTTEYYDMR